MRGAVIVQDDVVRRIVLRDKISTPEDPETLWREKPTKREECVVLSLI